jgi:hypothetical protein
MLCAAAEAGIQNIPAVTSMASDAVFIVDFMFFILLRICISYYKVIAQKVLNTIILDVVAILQLQIAGYKG